MKYFLSLGSNIDAEKNLDFAEKELNKILTNIPENIYAPQLSLYS